MGRAPRQQTKVKRRFDIHDVAQDARVSIATVSRTINGASTVNKALAQKVWKSIERLNYFPNTQARALVSGRSRLLGLLVSDVTNPFFPELIQGFESVAIKHGYDIMIGSTNYDPARMQLCIRRMLERGVEGVAVMTFGIEMPMLEELTSRGVPLVFMDESPNQPHVAAVPVDYRKGIEEGVRHLAELGHRRIAFVSGPSRQCSSGLRREAFLDSMKKAGLRAYAGLQVEGDHTLTGGVAAAEKLLAVKELPTAIICSNDMMALGVMRTLSQQTPAIRVPEEISVMGFDDIQFAALVHPPLTSVRLCREELARAAFEVLRAAAERGSTPARKTATLPSVSTRITIRQSTGPVCAGAGRAPRKKEPAKATVSRAAASRTARR